MQKNVAIPYHINSRFVGKSYHLQECSSAIHALLINCRCITNLYLGKNLKKAIIVRISWPLNVTGKS